MNCVPFALSIVSGRPAHKIKELLQEDGGYNRQKGRFPRSVYISALPKLGVKVLDRRENPHVTVNTWVRDIADQKSVWLVRISGHLMVCTGGTIIDNNDPTGKGESLKYYAKCRVKHAWKVAA